ncbi:MAG: hypothetical protein AAB478_03750 [Patescibacteria group bacterium]
MSDQIPQERISWRAAMIWICYALLIGLGCLLFLVCIVIAVVSASSGGPT